MADAWEGTWATTNEEDTNLIDQALTIQGVNFAVRKAATVARPKVTTRTYVKDGVPYLELIRPGVLGGSTTAAWPADGSTFDREEPLYGKVRMTVKKAGDAAFVITSQPQSNSPAWTAVAEWSVEGSGADRVQTRKSTVKSADGKEVVLVLKYKPVA
ncbi:hypothetical protein M427DRAFT_71584 [Gonapodya prolifera JEL478]|uniref:Uncharacterized protein n=1 Tax=Gonapodya prolifera (strain JEL478) TaxID=1344416 RepID=A0A139A912_GONPJ|nr:hypothetical protein M427DRAFT_71584 [Gonapodya prolifera JEL478]|eukprot:KXS13194.1 hypothetical protein M427DRAFT_71584 [Gonapodya prolifera JEL478]